MPPDVRHCAALIIVAIVSAAATHCASVDGPPGAAEEDAAALPAPTPSGDGSVASGTDAQGPRDASPADVAPIPTDASSPSDAADAPPPPAKQTIVWNGDSVTGGAGWATPSSNPISVQSSVAHDGAALEWDVIPQSVPWSEWGYNWKGFQKPGTPAVSAKAFTFYVKLQGNRPPGDIVVSLRSALDDKYAHQPPAPGGLRGVSLAAYAPSFADGAWHRVSIPMSDLLSGENTADFAQIYEIFMGAGGSDYQLYLDDLALEE